MFICSPVAAVAGNALIMQEKERTFYVDRKQTPHMA
jgi:hypothetical protein